MSAAEHIDTAQACLDFAVDEEGNTLHRPDELVALNVQYATANALIAIAESLHTQNLIGAVAIGAFPNALAEKAARKQIRARLSATTTQGEPT